MAITKHTKQNKSTAVAKAGRKTGLKASLALIALCSCLTGCTVSIEEGHPVAMKDIITIDSKETDVTENDQFAKHFFTESGLAAYTEVMEPLRESQTYQNIEWLYSQAYIKWYSKYLEAYNLGIINANGIPTGKVKDIRYSLAKYDRNELERLSPTSNGGTKEDFLKWLGSLYFCTTGPDIESDYPDILFYRFHTDSGKYLGYDTADEVKVATLPELEEWFRNFLYIEERNLANNPTKVYMTKEQIQERATELLKENYLNPQTDSNIQVLPNGEHGISRQYLTDLALRQTVQPEKSTKPAVATVNIYGQPVSIAPEAVPSIDLEDIQVDLVTNWQDVEENEAQSRSYIELRLKSNGTDKVYQLDLVNGKVYITKEQIQEILGTQSEVK